MAGFASITLGALLFMTCATWGSATDFTVGDSTGWTTNYNYSSWTSGKTFTIGDNLVFNFASGAHTVTEVSSSDYSSCSSSNAISSTSTGPATIQLKTSGEHYFICTITGHCNSGMKLAVNATTSSSGSPTTPPPPSSSGTPTPSPPSNTTKSHASVTRGFAPASAVAVLAGLMVTLF